MESKRIEDKIDQAAGAAKTLVAKADETREDVGRKAADSVANAQAVIQTAAKKSQHHFSETVEKASHRLEESASRAAHRAEVWADETSRHVRAAASRASRSGQRLVRKLTGK